MSRLDLTCIHGNVLNGQCCGNTFTTGGAPIPAGSTKEPHGENPERPSSTAAAKNHERQRGSAPGTPDHPTIAALFVAKDGSYYGLEGVDPWDEERDARLYAGPYPVVAHPPCARWSRLAGFTEARFGLKRGEDGGCFEAALRAVHAYGGVLEHPAFSSAWDRYGLPEPLWRGGWNYGLDGGASCYVEQGRYGLPVKKATWLYAYGVELPELRWGYTPDGDGDSANQNEHGGMDAWRDKFKGRREQWTNSQHRGGHYGLTATTPPVFRDVLIATARSSHLQQKVAA